MIGLVTLLVSAGLLCVGAIIYSHTARRGYTDPWCSPARAAQVTRQPVNYYHYNPVVHVQIVQVAQPGAAQIPMPAIPELEPIRRLDPTWVLPAEAPVTVATERL